MAEKLGGTAPADQIYRMVQDGRTTAEIAKVCSSRPDLVAAALVAPLPDPQKPLNWVASNTDSAASIYGGSIPAFTAQARIAYPFPALGGYTWGPALYPLPE